VDALLSAAQRAPELRLIFLWRGVLADEMEVRVRRMNLEKQVEILNRRVDVNDVLANVHASITLATSPAIVRAYPHSLMDSLTAGKPILVSRAIPMSDYVEQTSCGQVVESVEPDSILAAVDALMLRYEDLKNATREVGERDFSQQAMIASFQKVYDRVMHSTSQG
jgi:glycosyltransferase involved in cell wall biosynthesis